MLEKQHLVEEKALELDEDCNNLKFSESNQLTVYRNVKICDERRLALPVFTFWNNLFSKEEFTKTYDGYWYGRDDHHGPITHQYITSCRG